MGWGSTAVWFYILTFGICKERVKVESTGNSYSPPAVTLQIAKQFVKQKSKDIRLSMLAARYTRRIIRNGSITYLDRKDQSTILRLYTQHIILNAQLNRICRQHPLLPPPKCQVQSLMADCCPGPLKFLHIELGVKGQLDCPAGQHAHLSYCQTWCIIKEPCPTRASLMVEMGETS